MVPKAFQHTPDPSFMLDNKFRIKGLDGACCMCGGPFHPATGSDDGRFKTCGACVRSLIAGMKDCANPRRTCSGVPFYIHAFPPRT